MPNILNQNIKNFRIFRGLTQEDLASKLNKTAHPSKLGDVQKMSYQIGKEGKIIPM